MTKFEHIEAVSLAHKKTTIRSSSLPEIVHLDDPAFSVMADFTKCRPATITSNEPMDNALNDMKVQGLHFLVVVDELDEVVGLITSEDLLGEKPIKILQERRMPRNKVKVGMLMTNIENMTAIPLKAIRHARVGNIVETLKTLNQHYAFVVDDEQNDSNCLCGMFSTWQISRQLHHDIADSMTKAHSVSELQRRHRG